jgi:drug/metabolite transporter (DMT)-like permease
VLSLFQQWQPVTLAQLAMLAAASVFLSSGYMLLIRAMRAGDVSLIVPFRYSGLLAALTIGFVVWGEIPNALAWAGIALLVAAGLYMVISERARARDRVLESAPE